MCPLRTNVRCSRPPKAPHSSDAATHNNRRLGRRRCRRQALAETQTHGARWTPRSRAVVACLVMRSEHGGGLCGHSPWIRTTAKAEAMTPSRVSVMEGLRDCASDSRQETGNLFKSSPLDASRANAPTAPSPAPADHTAGVAELEVCGVAAQRPVARRIGPSKQEGPGWGRRDSLATSRPCKPARTGGCARSGMSRGQGRGACVRTRRPRLLQRRRFPGTPSRRSVAVRQQRRIVANELWTARIVAKPRRHHDADDDSHPRPGLDAPPGRPAAVPAGRARRSEPAGSQDGTSCSINPRSS